MSAAFCGFSDFRILVEEEDLQRIRWRVGVAGDNFDIQQFKVNSSTTPGGLDVNAIVQQFATQDAGLKAEIQAYAYVKYFNMLPCAIASPLQKCG